MDPELEVLTVHSRILHRRAPYACIRAGERNVLLCDA